MLKCNHFHADELSNCRSIDCQKSKSQGTKNASNFGSILFTNILRTFGLSIVSKIECFFKGAKPFRQQSLVLVTIAP